jgi:hypothetical protein
VSVPLVPLSNVPEVVFVPVVFSTVVVPEPFAELFTSPDVLPESTEPELLLLVFFLVVVVFFVPVLFVRLPEVCASAPAVKPASINAVKNAFFMIMYLIRNLLLRSVRTNALPTFLKTVIRRFILQFATTVPKRESEKIYNTLL